MGMPASGFVQDEGGVRGSGWDFGNQDWLSRLGEVSEVGSNLGWLPSLPSTAAAPRTLSSGVWTFQVLLCTPVGELGGRTGVLPS